MKALHLVGRTVRVLPDDLFQRGITAVIRLIDQDSNSMLLEFDSPVEVGGRTYSLAVARPRLERDDLHSLTKDGFVGFGMICIPHDRFNPEKPFDVSWWRGGWGASIADVSLL